MKNYHSYIRKNLDKLTEDKIAAKAEIKGSVICSCVNGSIIFYKAGASSDLYAVITLFGLPDNSTPEIFIHDNFSCGKFVLSGTSKREIRQENATILTRVQSNGGFAFCVFYTEKYKLSSLVGKTVSVWDGNDRIGCGTLTFVC